MRDSGPEGAPYVFVSYSSRDRARALGVVGALEAAGVRVWVDQRAIAGGRSWGREIVQGIRECAVHVVLCSDAAMRSRNVLQEVQLAWKYERPYLPLLLEPTTFPEEVEYWLEGWQWVDVHDRPPEQWLPDVLRALEGLGIGGAAPAGGVGAQPRAAAPAAESATARLPPASPPETRYARSGDLFIAYQVLGDGPIDVVMTPGAVSHLELAWENPGLARLMRQLAAFCRLITYDKRGTGMSDRVSDRQLPSVEERMDDVRAVMDAAGSERAALLGVSEGGPMSILFAATYPERVAGLILYGTFATAAGKQLSDAERAQVLEQIAQSRGTPADARAFLQRYAPSVADDPAMQRWWAKVTRLGATPGAQMALTKMNWEIDVAQVLPSVRVPTLVLHHGGDRVVPIGAGRSLAERIPDARLVELPGEDHMLWVSDQADVIVEEIRRFVGAIEPADAIEQVLATVLAIAGEAPAAQRTSVAALVEREASRYRGHLATGARDGAVATFDGPARAVRCARAILLGARGLGLALRAGVHTGACDVSGDRVGGPAVQAAQALAEAAAPGEVLLSGSVQDLIAGAGIATAERGTQPLPGQPGEWRLFAMA